jgi:lipopolysaccharide heptosyltransferase II
MIELERFPSSLLSASVSPEWPVTGSQSMPSFTDLNLQRVLVIRLDSVGDVVLMGPALRTLRGVLPEARITLLTSPAGSQAAPLLPWIDNVIISEALWQDPQGRGRFNPERELGLIDEITEGNFDAALIFTGYLQSPLPAAYACYLAGIPHRLGFSRSMSGGVLSFIPSPPAEELHQVDRNLALLEAMGVPVGTRNLELQVPTQVQKNADQLLRSAGIRPDQPFIVLSPGAGTSAHRYSAQRFASVLRMISAEAGIPIVITGSARESEAIKPVTDAARAVRTGRIISLVGRTTVPEFAAIIRRSALTIANNSAALQIADAFHRPLVALYSGRDLVSQWMPRNSRARLLCRPVHCAPCYQLECPFALECLDIRPDEVAIAALELLAERIYFRAPMKRPAGARI